VSRGGSRVAFFALVTLLASGADCSIDIWDDGPAIGLCAVDADCGVGQSCDVDGVCNGFPRVCNDDDCDAGSACVDGLCEPVIAGECTSLASFETQAAPQLTIANASISVDAADVAQCATLATPLSSFTLTLTLRGPYTSALPPDAVEVAFDGNAPTLCSAQPVAADCDPPHPCLVACPLCLATDEPVDVAVQAHEPAAGASNAVCAAIE
jgi:hypothetical protein